ncbi:MAG: Hsp20/alpha crystallin family protein [Candidatus Omnitrophica bacterium]|nr:Hsp20/alpha crystallin family protein [Candidatus Omnitrophota bacterium]
MKNYPLRKQNESWYPFSEIRNLHNEMNRLFDFSFPHWDGETSLMSGQWTPAIDVHDSKDNIVIKADLPGLKKEDINVSVQDDLLTISGEKKKESEVKEEDYIRTERYYGSFHRALRLPGQVDAAKVNATFKDGVLQLTLPKKEEAKPKQITIDVK